MRLLLPLSAALLLTACPSTSQDPLDPAVLTALRLAVVHEVGAEPYEGPVGPTQGDTWDLFEGNAEALFAGTGVAVEARPASSTWTSFPEDGVTGYDSAALVALAEQHAAPGLAADGTRTVVALWLDGRLLIDGEESSTVLGVSLGSTSVIAMFKPVIESLGQAEVVRRFGEQTVLIHEFGHAVGLVSNGVPVTAPHHDEENGAHCTDDECVMYWANEGVGDLVEFVQQFAVTGSAVVFGDDCLNDVRAHYTAE